MAKMMGPGYQGGRARLRWVAAIGEGGVGSGAGMFVGGGACSGWRRGMASCRWHRAPGIGEDCAKSTLVPDGRREMKHPHWGSVRGNLEDQGHRTAIRLFGPRHLTTPKMGALEALNHCRCSEAWRLSSRIAHPKISMKIRVPSTQKTYPWMDAPGWECLSLPRGPSGHGRTVALSVSRCLPRSERGISPSEREDSPPPSFRAPELPPFT